MSETIILNAQETISCPHCARQFALSEAMTHQLIDRYEGEYEAMLAEERKALKQQLQTELSRKQAREVESRLADLQAQLDASQAETLSARKQIETAKAHAEKAVRTELQQQARALETELSEREKQLATYRESELTLRRKQKALEDKQAELALEVERRVAAERAQAALKIREDFALREAEYKKKISDAQKSNEALTRQLEQGSQQLRGEVLELELEAVLRQNFPTDQISEVKKGARGADVVQAVHLRSGTHCGAIIWETKRAKNWSNSWITKLKDDQQTEGADLAVLVSTVFPANISEPMLAYEGVWLVKPAFARSLAEALRTVLIETQRQRTVSASKDEQMEALFDYICSNQFAQRVRTVVEGYEEMQSDLEKEKRAMQRIWKKREGQINRISGQVLNLCGELQGISHSSLPHLNSIAPLELGE